MSTADVTVFGAGIFGLSVAWSCILRGAKVRVIEKRFIGAGASGGFVGALAPHTPDVWDEKKQFQFESLIMAEAYWANIAAISGLSPGYARSGRVQSVPDAKALKLAESRTISAQELWRGKAIWQVEEAGTRGGWAPASPTGKLIYDTLSARIYPKQAIEALAEAIRLKRGEIIMGEAAAQGIAVYATGYEGLLELSEILSCAAGNGVKGQALLLEYDAKDKPQLFANGLHIVPHGNGTVAIGSTSERFWSGPTRTDASLDDLHARALASFPVLQGARVLQRWAGVRPRAKSLAPMLGPHPLHADTYIANGGFKIGFGMAPKVGEVMADLILNDRDIIPETFRVEASL